MKKVFILFMILVFAYLTYRLYPRVKSHFIQYVEEERVISLDKVITSKELKTLDGKSWSIQKHIGKKIIIIFWAKSCSYCIKEIPHVKKL